MFVALLCLLHKKIEFYYSKINIKYHPLKIRKQRYEKSAKKLLKWFMMTTLRVARGRRGFRSQDQPAMVSNIDDMKPRATFFFAKKNFLPLKIRNTKILCIKN